MCACVYACGCVCACVYACGCAYARVQACLSFYFLLFYSRNVAPFWDEAAPFWQRHPPDRNAFRDSILPSDMFIHCLSTRLSTMLSTDEKKEKLRTSWLILAFPEEESPKGRGREGAYRKPPAPLALPFRCRRKSDVTRRLIFPRRRSLLYSKRAKEREPRKPRRLGSPLSTSSAGGCHLIAIPAAADRLFSVKRISSFGCGYFYCITYTGPCRVDAPNDGAGGMNGDAAPHFPYSTPALSVLVMYLAGMGLSKW